MVDLFSTFHLFYVFSCILYLTYHRHVNISFILDVKKEKQKTRQMSSHINTEEHDPVANLTMLPTRSILKTSKSIDTGRLEKHQEMTSYPTTGMTRSDSKK